MNNYNQDEQEFLSLLKKENAVANPVFKARLKAKMLEELQPKKSIFNIFALNFNLLAIVAFSFITVISGSIILTELFNSQNVKTTTVASSEVKRQVLEKVSEKTSVVALNLLNVEEFLNTESLGEPIKENLESDYNLKTTSLTYVPLIETNVICRNLNLPTSLTTTELFEYFEEDRTIAKLKVNNQVLKVEEFIKKPNKNPSSYPISYTEPLSYSTGKSNIEVLLKTFNNLQLTETIDTNKKTLTLTDFVLFNCGNTLPASFPLSFANNPDKVIREFILNEDFTINKVNLYLNQILVDNKIAEITIDTVIYTISKEEAQDLLYTEETNAKTQKEIERSYLDFNSDTFNNLIKSDTKIVLFFYASWCPTCKELDNSLNQAYIPSGLQIIKIPYDQVSGATEESTALSKKYNVTYQHTLVYIDSEAELIKKWNGGFTIEDILEQI